MSSPFGNSRNVRGYGIGPNVFDHVASPVGIQFSQRTQSPGHNSLETSPLFTAASLPPRTMSRDSCKNPNITVNRNFTFVNLDASNSHRSYPSVFVNGTIEDVNEIVKNIVLNRPPSTYTGPDTGTQSHICPFSHVPITCPVRGTTCYHAQCFDLREFLIAQDNESWKCPVCQQPLTIDTIAFDPFYFAPSSPTPAAGIHLPISDIPMQQENMDMWDAKPSLFDQSFDQF